MAIYLLLGHSHPRVEVATRNRIPPGGWLLLSQSVPINASLPPRLVGESPPESLALGEEGWLPLEPPLPPLDATTLSTNIAPPPPLSARLCSVCTFCVYAASCDTDPIHP